MSQCEQPLACTTLDVACELLPAPRFGVGLLLDAVSRLCLEPTWSPISCLSHVLVDQQARSALDPVIPWGPGTQLQPRHYHLHQQTHQIKKERPSPSAESPGSGSEICSHETQASSSLSSSFASAGRTTHALAILLPTGPTTGSPHSRPSQGSTQPDA